jgi:predicted ATPase with chaperone activity
MLERDRRREGLRICRAAWLLGGTVREYRALEVNSSTLAHRGVLFLDELTNIS